MDITSLILHTNVQDALSIHPVAHSVSLFKSVSDFCDQSDTFCKTFVEG